MTKKILVTLFICCLCAFNKANAQNRQSISLDGSWGFAIDSTHRGLTENWQNGIPIQVSKTVKVPHTWNIESGTEEYAGLAWYQKEFKVPEDWKNKTIRLKFGAVYHNAIVFMVVLSK